MSGQSAGQSVASSKPIIEPGEFVRRGEVRAGEAPRSRLPRLAELVSQPFAPLVWRAEGEIAKGLSGRAGWLLHLTVKGELTLSCQRCLENMTLPVELAAHILMVPEGQPLPDDELEEDRFDAISVGQTLDLLELVEGELLLSLPVVPKHESCEPPDASKNQKAQSPFAVLARLKADQ